MQKRVLQIKGNASHFFNLSRKLTVYQELWLPQKSQDCFKCPNCKVLKRKALRVFKTERMVQNSKIPRVWVYGLKFDFSFEVYFHNKSNIDTYAIPTLLVRYYYMPVGMIRDKNEKGKT